MKIQAVKRNFNDHACGFEFMAIDQVVGTITGNLTNRYEAVQHPNEIILEMFSRFGKLFRNILKRYSLSLCIV